MCGAATHPAGSVIALNGRNAAAAVLADQGAALAGSLAAGDSSAVGSRRGRERTRADPRGRLRPDRGGRHRRRPHRARRDARRRLDARSSTTTSRPARSCSSRRWSTRSRRAGDERFGDRARRPRRATAGLARAIASCLPLPGPQERDWVLWVELWLRAVRDPSSAPVAARLYARYREWFAAAIRAGVESGEFEVDAVGGRARGPGDRPDRRSRCSCLDRGSNTRGSPPFGSSWPGRWR